MAIFETTVGGRTVQVSRLGVAGPPGKDAEFPENTITTTESGLNTIDVMSLSEIRSATYLVQLSAEGGHQFAELHLIHDDFSVYITQTGETIIMDSLGTFLADIVGDEIVLSCDVVYPETKITFKKITLSNVGSPYTPFPGDLMLLDVTLDLQTSSCPDVDLMIL